MLWSHYRNVILRTKTHHTEETVMAKKKPMMKKGMGKKMPAKNDAMPMKGKMGKKLEGKIIG